MMQTIASQCLLLRDWILQASSIGIFKCVKISTTIKHIYNISVNLTENYDDFDVNGTASLIEIVPVIGHLRVYR